ncbi:tRNA(Ile)-lysidine synthase [Vibrio orientalis CIP 102891 = ATCC 33934]|uniref:tRNA(Ile)-lysidine synthase n=1 Tax=Vibrio orientalis CIP 102891 = ATCC 33934 TaxID=675816 RepID=C9QMJ6_VIBOR|nr:tRNA lysidine(34) synthetase TilS [Vibrio orientalis]EEX93091.1 tRNA(Ile)-lysidine synthetase [Vibrio orientalis CIP 102891 = ATCC 33934]EGU50156.1 tRNA(Ile)-lysidine synthase [Vibrio orientalis CIP 102891 = ATCC 33934]
MKLKSTFYAAIDQYYQPNTRIVLGLSGGLDSRVMLELLAQYAQQYRVDCLAVHVHHGLSDNADQWAEQCQHWCQSLNVQLVVEKVSLDIEGRSIEESAREARYNALRKYLSSGDLLLTGQHADDQLETFLLALKRGSGPKGLSSMAAVMPFASAQIVRPLLSVTRQEIEEFAQSLDLEWVEDESNQDQRFERNFIRHNLTPNMRERWPHIHQSVRRSAELCAEQEQLLDELMAEKLSAALHSDSSLEIATLAEMSELARTRLLRMWLGSLGLRMPSRIQLDKLWQEVAQAQQDANPQLTLADGQIRRFAHKLYVVQAWQSLEQWQCSLQLEQVCELPDELGQLALVSSPNGKLSLKALAQAPLQVIFNPEGLSAHPAERGHSRKLKKLFQEYGVPSWLRRRTPIVMCGERVVAVGDLFIDRHFIGQDCELIWDKL